MMQLRKGPHHLLQRRAQPSPQPSEGAGNDGGEGGGGTNSEQCRECEAQPPPLHGTYIFYITYL